MKKYIPFAVITLLLALLFRTNEQEIRQALNLPMAAGSVQSYSMADFQQQFGWGISDLRINEENQTFSYVVTTGPEKTLYLNKRFLVDSLSAVDFTLRPEAMNYRSEDEWMITPNDQVLMSALTEKRGWRMGMYRAVLNMWDDERQYHWVVIYSVDRNLRISHIQEKIFVGQTAKDKARE